MTKRKQKQFLELYEPVHANFERFCRARIDGYRDHRDLMNDTLVVAFQKFDSLKSRRAFLSFLCGIAIRILANNRRKRRTHAARSEDITQYAADDRTDLDAEIAILYSAIAKLPVGQKECIILFEISGFTIKEIAAIHEVSESAVRQRLVRGRSKLAQLLTCVPQSKITTHES